MRDAQASIKIVALLVENEKMKLHTAAGIASRYTTGPSPEATTRRLVKRFKVATHEYLKTRAENKNDTETEIADAATEGLPTAEAARRVVVERLRGPLAEEGPAEDYLVVFKAIRDLTDIVHEMVRKESKFGPITDSYLKAIDGIEETGGLIVVEFLKDHMVRIKLNLEMVMIYIEMPKFFDALIDGKSA
jgi:hypothetical protein